MKSFIASFYSALRDDRGSRDGRRTSADGGAKRTFADLPVDTEGLRELRYETIAAWKECITIVRIATRSIAFVSSGACCSTTRSTSHGKI